MKEHNFGLEPSVKSVITLMLSFPKEKMGGKFVSVKNTIPGGGGL